MEYGMIGHLTKLGPRSAQAFVALKRVIDNGHYAPGDRLPSEGELVRQIGVSRTALRRAVACLAADGVIEVRHGSGMYLGKSSASAQGSSTVSVMYPFSSEDLASLQDMLLAKGCLLCVFSQRHDHWNPQVEKRFLDQVRREGHRALLAFCSPIAPRNDEALAASAASGVRVIHIDHYREQLPDQEYLLPDYRKAGHMAAVELMLAGCEQIVSVGLATAAPYGLLHQRGVADALTEHGLGFDLARNRFVIPPAFFEHPESVAALVATATGAGAVGFACESTGLASSVTRVLRDYGVQIPDQASVIGTELIGPHTQDLDTDRIVFDRHAILRRAAESALTGSRDPLRELVQPEIRRLGTVRGRHVYCGSNARSENQT